MRKYTGQNLFIFSVVLLLSGILAKPAGAGDGKVIITNENCGGRDKEISVHIRDADSWKCGHWWLKVGEGQTVTYDDLHGYDPAAANRNSACMYAVNLKVSALGKRHVWGGGTTHVTCKKKFDICDCSVTDRNYPDPATGVLPVQGLDCPLVPGTKTQHRCECGDGEHQVHCPG